MKYYYKILLETGRSFGCKGCLIIFLSNIQRKYVVKKVQSTLILFVGDPMCIIHR